MATQPPIRLILASASTARRDLLTKAGYQFEMIPSQVDEPTQAGFTDPRTLVEHIAWLKAAAVAKQVKDGIILAADTVGWHHGQVIGKPADETDARRILTLLSGNRHELWTGVCLWRRPDDLQLAWQEMSLVEMSPMSRAEISHYLKTRTWAGCSGAYAIQESDDPYVRVISGSVTNVIGLPMEKLEQVLAVLYNLVSSN